MTGAAKNAAATSIRPAVLPIQRAVGWMRCNDGKFKFVMFVSVFSSHHLCYENVCSGSAFC
ncbi:hypothetical protein D3C71_1884320 [compost metagenome]